MNKEFDKLRALKLFINIAHEESFSRAAKIMGMSASNASKEITTLEEELEIKLLFRTTRMVSLTENGKIYLDGAVKIINQLEALSDSLLGKKTCPKGVLRITAPSVWGQIVLSPLLNKFKLIYPEIILEIDFSNRLVDMVGERFDVAIRNTALTDTSFYAIKLAEHKSCICASKNYLKKNGTPKEHTDLKNHDCITFTNGPGTINKWHFLKGRKSCSVQIKGSYRVNDIRAILNAAKDGVGICKLPYYLVSKDLRLGRLVSLFDNVLDGNRATYAFYSQKREYTPKLDFFLRFLEDHRDQLNA